MPCIISSVKLSIAFTEINYRTVFFMKLILCGDRSGCCRNDCRKLPWGTHRARGKGRCLEVSGYAPALAETNLRSKQATGWIMSILHKKRQITEVYKWGMWSSNPSASLPCNILFNSEHYIISSPEENNGDDGKSGRSEPGERLNSQVWSWKGKVRAEKGPVFK